MEAPVGGSGNLPAVIVAACDCGDRFGNYSGVIGGVEGEISDRPRHGCPTACFVVDLFRWDFNGPELVLKTRK